MCIWRWGRFVVSVDKGRGHILVRVLVIQRDIIGAFKGGSEGEGPREEDNFNVGLGLDMETGTCGASWSVARAIIGCIYELYLTSIATILSILKPIKLNVKVAFVICNSIE